MKKVAKRRYPQRRTMEKRILGLEAEVQRLKDCSIERVIENTVELFKNFQREASQKGG